MTTPEQTITDSIALSIVACVDTLAQRMTQQDASALRAQTLDTDRWQITWQPLHSGEGMISIGVTDGPLAAFCPPGRVFFCSGEAQARAVRDKLFSAVTAYWTDYDAALADDDDDTDDTDDTDDDDDDDTDDDDDDDTAALASLEAMPPLLRAAAILGAWQVDADFVRDVLDGHTKVNAESLAVFVAALEVSPPLLRAAMQSVAPASDAVFAAWCIVLAHFSLWLESGDDCHRWLEVLAADTDPERQALLAQMRAVSSGRASHYAAS